MRAYLGIDSATTTGWCLVRGEPSREQVVDHGTATIGPIGAASAVEMLVNQVRRNTMMAELVVGIEDQYLDKNVQTVKVLARIGGRFMQAFEQAGAAVELVPAATWQSAVLGRFGGKRRADRKKAAAIWARSIAPGLTQDEADGLGIAVHLLRRDAYEAKVSRAAR